MPKKIIILGSGESGAGAAVLAKQRGYDVFVSDGAAIPAKYKDELENWQIPFEENGHDIERILAADEIMKSPGIPEKAAIMQAIRAKGIPVISEIELAYRYVGDSKIVAITGANGKTTTTSLLFHICQTAGLQAALVGNIGNSIARQVALDPVAWYITEVSSFQLDDIHRFKPYIAILTNITEDHLDRYEYQFEKYIHSKFRIIENQDNKDFFVYCADDPITVHYLPKYKNQTNLLPFTMKNEVRQGAYIKNEEMLLKVKEEEVRMSINDFKLIGKHNQYNTMAACISARVMDIRDEKIRESVQTFQGLEHRMEFVATIRGVDYINDSKATNMNSTWFALGSMEKPTILILGGVDKGNDYSIIDELVQEKVKGIICLGIDNQKIKNHFEGTVGFLIETNSAAEAVQVAYGKSTNGDVVLLSPGCASFDLFKNYEDRGIQFKEAVKSL